MQANNKVKCINMTYRKVFKHPLIEPDEKIDKEENDNEYHYSKSEFIITSVSAILIIISLLCFWFFFNMDEDPNPMVAFALIPITILYLVGLITSVVFVWYSYGERLKTKIITSISFLVYLGILIHGLI